MSGFVEFTMEQLSMLGVITARSMFGGHCLYCDGVVFALIADDVLYLKADKQNRPDFEAAGLPPFRPFDDKPTVMQYYLAPAEMFEDPEELRRWAGGAVQAGRRAQRKTPRGRRAK